MSFDSTASFDGLGFFAAMAGVYWVPVGGTNVGDWDLIARKNAGRHLQGKKSDVSLYLQEEKKDGGRRRPRLCCRDGYAPYVFTKNWLA